MQDNVGRLIIDGVVDSELYYAGSLHISLFGITANILTFPFS